MARTKPKAVAEKRSTNGTSLDLEALRQIVDILESSEVTRLVWSNGHEKVSIRRGPLPVTPVVQHLAESRVAARQGLSVGAPPTAQATPPPFARPSTGGRGAAAVDEKKGQIITSPFVGTFYRSPAPDQPSFAEMGSLVKKGQVLCIVEAMKLMNEIESDLAGKVVEVLAQNGQPVEFGQPLFRIEPA
jgi:acetyl-CoA carboxylase biotin carboxyl carrier protein